MKWYYDPSLTKPREKQKNRKGDNREDDHFLYWDWVNQSFGVNIGYANTRFRKMSQREQNELRIVNAQDGQDYTARDDIKLLWFSQMTNTLCIERSEDIGFGETTLSEIWHVRCHAYLGSKQLC